MPAEVFRNYGVVTLTATGSGTHTFTANRKLRVRGWKYVMQMTAHSQTTASAALQCTGEITRATALSTNYALDTCNGVIQGIQNVGATDLVGGYALGNPVMERYLSKSEADELGLLLDYGESLRAILTITVGACTVVASMFGLIFYEEV